MLRDYFKFKRDTSEFNEIYQALIELASHKEKEQKSVNPVGYLSYD